MDQVVMELHNRIKINVSKTTTIVRGFQFQIGEQLKIPRILLSNEAEEGGF